MGSANAVALRDYQDQGVEDIRDAFRRSLKAPLYVLPTGGGKTYTYAYIAQQAADKGNKIVILEHRKELIRQASLSLASIGVKHGIIAPQDKISAIRKAHVEKIGQPMIVGWPNVYVASVQTLARRMDWLKEFDPDMIIVDEAHHSVAGTWLRIKEACPNCRYLGVTATPERADGAGLKSFYDTMIHGPTVSELIEKGALVPPRVFSPPLKANLDDVPKRGKDWDPEALAEILDKPTITGDAVKHYRKLAPGKAAIVFCASVKHAVHVCDAFKADGWKFVVVTGDMDDIERDRAISDLASRRIHGIVTVDVVSEGTDIPVAEVAIMLRATQSLALYLQQGGRVLRPVYADGFDLNTDEGRLDAIAHSDKLYGLILDHVGNVFRHGFPDEDRAWSLEGKKGRQRSEAAESSGPAVRQCPECYMAHAPAPTCPSCGFMYSNTMAQHEQRDGELEELTPSPEEIMRKAARRRQGKTETFKEMVDDLGYSPGRAAKIIQARKEKEALQKELTELLERFTKSTGLGIKQSFGFTAGEVRTMKPKQLKESIKKVSEDLFMSQGQLKIEEEHKANA